MGEENAKIREDFANAQRIAAAAKTRKACETERRESKNAKILRMRGVAPQRRRRASDAERRIESEKTRIFCECAAQRRRICTIRHPTSPVPSKSKLSSKTISPRRNPRKSPLYRTDAPTERRTNERTKRWTQSWMKGRTVAWMRTQRKIFGLVPLANTDQHRIFSNRNAKRRT